MNNPLNDAVGATGKVRQAIMVWDMPVRVFHWLLVICFAGAWLSSESERWALIHYAFGYTACLLVLIRLVWGVIGTRYARFSQFLKSPKAVIGHFMAMLRGHPHHTVGHNPAGGLVMFALMLLILLVGLTGYLSVKEFLGNLASEAHEAVASLALGLVIIHIIAAIGMSWIERQNLVRSMVSGKKKACQNREYVIRSMSLASSYFWVRFTFST